MADPRLSQSGLWKAASRECGHSTLAKREAAWAKHALPRDYEYDVEHQQRPDGGPVGDGFIAPAASSMTSSSVDRDAGSN
ncbi:MAG: hypothetical protein ACR2RL_08640 [Gammaproteobacteria bacterium]